MIRCLCVKNRVGSAVGLVPPSTKNLQLRGKWQKQSDGETWKILKVKIQDATGVCEEEVTLVLESG